MHPVFGYRDRIQNAVLSRLPIAKDSLNLGRPSPSRANRRNDVTPAAGSRRRALKFRQIRQSFAAIGDQKFQQSLTTHGVHATALNAAFAALRHQSRRNELRDVVGERRFGDAKLALNRADGQAALPGSDQQAKYLQAIRVTQLGETSRRVLERHAARLGRSPHPQPTSSARGARRRDGSRWCSFNSSIK